MHTSHHLYASIHISYISTHFWKTTQYKDALGRSKLRSCWREQTWGQWPTFGKTMKSSTVSNCPYALPRATGSQGSFSPHAINVGTWEAKWKPVRLLFHKIRKNDAKLWIKNQKMKQSNTNLLISVRNEEIFLISRRHKNTYLCNCTHRSWCHLYSSGAWVNIYGRYKFTFTAGSISSGRGPPE